MKQARPINQWEEGHILAEYCETSNHHDKNRIAHWGVKYLLLHTHSHLLYSPDTNHCQLFQLSNHSFMHSYTSWSSTRSADLFGHPSAELFHILGSSGHSILHRVISYFILLIFKSFNWPTIHRIIPAFNQLPSPILCHFIIHPLHLQNKLVAQIRLPSLLLTLQKRVNSNLEGHWKENNKTQMTRTKKHTISVESTMTFERRRWTRRDKSWDLTRLSTRRV